MATLGEYLGAGSATTKLLLHLNGNSTDSSGNGNNGTDTAITYSAGKFGQGAGFNGTTSQIIFNPITALQVQAFTINAWVNPDTDYKTFIYQVNGAAAFYIAYQIYIGENNVYIVQMNGSAYTLSVNFTPTITKTWNHFSFVYTGSAWLTYLNGNLVNTTSAPAIYYGGSSSTKYIYIGKNPVTTAETWTKAIDEVIVENRAWTASEVKKYYTYSRGMFGL